MTGKCREIIEKILEVARTLNCCPLLFYVIFFGNILLAVVFVIALIRCLCGVQTISQQHLFKMKNVFKKTSCHFSFSFKKLSQY